MSTNDPTATAPSAGNVQALRPLSIGEVLDRGFSICFKNIVPFSAIVLVVVGPQLLCYYLGFKNVLDLIGDQFALMQGAGALPPDPAKMLDAYAQGGPWLALTGLIGLVFVPLSNAAIVSGVSRAYLGLPVRFKECYGDAVPRWLALVLLLLLWFAAGVVAFIAFVLFFAILGAAIGAMSTLLHTFGAILGIAIGIAVFIGLILSMVMIYLAAAFSFTGAVLEGLGPADAFSSGFRRVFGEGQFRRSLGIGAALFGVLIGFGMVGAVIGMVAIGITHSFAIEFAVSAVVNAFTYPFAFAVVAVSYYDVRIRREGFDLQLLASRLGATASP
jgi:hypothetical protein